jgi:hypothetical protein
VVDNAEELQILDAGVVSPVDCFTQIIINNRLREAASA